MAAVLFWCLNAFGYEGLEWGRYRLRPEVWIGEVYSDNIYLTKTDTKGDFYTHILPKVALDYAIAPRHYVSVAYKGDYQFHSRFDNFTEFQHRGDLWWSLETAKGSTFKAGAWIKDGAVQPYFEQDFSKTYVEWEAFSQNRIEAGQFTEVGFEYRHTSRRFDDDFYHIDDYDRDSVRLDATYDQFWHLPLLLEYRIDRWDNAEVSDEFSRDSLINTVFVGARWKPGARLSGALRLGYTYAAYDEAENFGGFAMDTELNYRFSDFTNFKLTLVRLTNTSTTAERETGYYYVNTGGSFGITYTRWDPLTFKMNVEYMHQQYEQYQFEGDRVDHLYNAGITGRYEFFDWLAAEIEYQYERDDTDAVFAEYTENRVEFRVDFSY